ncbi:MAG: ABC transporter permease [Bdellovibrionales bacterium]|nr:ABC transporter permease [Bdellovibrionales bacterium]
MSRTERKLQQETPNPLERAVANTMHEFGGAWIFFNRVMRTFKRTKGHKSAIIQQVADVSTRTIGTVIFAGVFVGAILVLQFDVMLRRFDAQALLGGLNTSATIREVGPLIISFLLAGKVGAYTTAELANMRVTEQIDAIECLGTNPIQYLIIPRFFAIILSSVVLLAIGLSVSVIGAILVAQTFSDINLYQYISSIPRFAGAWTLFEGLFRSVLFSTIVATISTFKGYTATGGARGVGRAVTESAIYINVYIVIVNFISSSILEWVHDFIFWIGALLERITL